MSIGIYAIFFIFISVCSGLRTSKSIELTPKGGEMVKSKYISRFAVPYGSTLFASVRVKLQSTFDSNVQFPLTASFFDDDEWDEALHTGNCDSSRAIARYNLPITLRGDGEWSNWESYQVENIPKNQVWYIVVSDCQGSTHEAYPQLPKIEVDLHILNSGSEFSHEEYGVMTLYIILLIIYVYFLATTSYKVITNALRKDEVDNAVMACAFAIYMELLHIGAQTIHLFLFNQNGQGFFLLDLISNVLQMNSQIVIVGLFILIAFGWEITDVDLSKDNKMIFLGGGILVTHTIIAYLTAFDDGEHHKYHDYGGFQGLALISIRFILYGIFLYGVVTTLPKVNAKVKGFLKALSAAGTLYMLTFPTLWFFSFIITAHLRNRLIVFGNLLAQLFAIIIMLNQFSKKGTRFYEVANKSKDILSGKDK